MDLSISIVSFNTKNLLRKCISSIYKFTSGISFEVIVVDNGSVDGSVDMIKRQFPKVKLITNSKNLFFTKANNLALKIARGRYILILNSDTYFKDNSLKKIVEYMNKHKNVGAVEGLEIYESGEAVPNGSLFSTPIIDFYELSILGKRLKNQKIINSYRLKNKNRRDIFEIDVGCDAFLCVRKEIMDRIGGYDENFLLYYTENDLCLRIKILGYKIVHFGEAFVYHTVSASANKLGWKKMDIYYRDLYYYYKKHGYRFTGFLLFLLLKVEQAVLRVLRSSMFLNEAI